MKITKGEHYIIREKWTPENVKVLVRDIDEEGSLTIVTYIRPDGSPSVATPQTFKELVENAAHPLVQHESIEV